jgi:hypothetical protein
MLSKTLAVFALVGALSFLAQPGIAQEAGTIHPSWPMENGIKHQPIRDELRALHDRDVTPADAREIDRLYNELISSGGGTYHTGISRMLT